MDTARRTLLIALLLVTWATGPAMAAPADVSPKADTAAEEIPPEARPGHKAPEKEKPGPQEGEKTKKEPPLREIRVAVFDFDVVKEVEGIDGKALTDQINAMLSMLEKVTIVNRDEIQKVADEHKMTLSGLVDPAEALKLGKFLNAHYIVVGRASRIGATNYLVAKIIDVQTTVQTTIPEKASVEFGFEVVLTRFSDTLRVKVRKLQRPESAKEDPELKQLRKTAEQLKGKVLMISISERHVDRPLRDPAAQMAATHRLRDLGLTVLVPRKPRPGWQEAVLVSGKYLDKKVDYLIEGEGVSAFAAQFHNLVSCRARVELRLTKVPGREILVTEKGVAARVDLVEALAAKAALEEAATQAVDALITRLAKDTRKAAEEKK